MTIARALRRTVVAATTLMTGRDVGANLTRYAMYDRLPGAVAGFSPGRVLAISHSRPLCEVVGWAAADIVEANYPEIDLLDLPFASGEFDAIVSDQVLEHVIDPSLAMRESARVVRPGGIVLHTTCFMNPVHGAPMDYWRFTADGLRQLADREGLDVIQVGAWGNFSAVLLIRMGLRYVAVPNNPRHPLHRTATRDKPQWPIVTWIACRV